MTATTEEGEFVSLKPGSGEMYKEIGEQNDKTLYRNQVTGGYAVDDGTRVEMGKSKAEAEKLFPELF